MQTFLPYPDFEQSARCLDTRRLGKQRVEALQMLNCLAGRSRGWRNHPAVRMWRGHAPALRAYLNACIREWVRRGHRNGIPLRGPGRVVPPPWLGCEQFHRSHRSNLLRKYPEHYRRFGWDEPDDLPYCWPV